MGLKLPQTMAADVIVIGGGGAGLRAAIEARERGANVLLVSKSRVGYGNNTAKSGGSLSSASAAAETEDSPELHLKDTVAGGRFLNDQKLVQMVARGSGQQIEDLERFGVKFRRLPTGRLYVFSIPGHTCARNVRGAKLIGVELSVPMRQFAASIGVRFLEGVMVTRLLTSGGVCVGAVGIDGQGQAFILTAPATVLAAAGMGQVYLRSNNVSGATGDGYALAYRAGLTLKDMEFVQYYPCGLGEFGGDLWLYEAFVVGEGAILRNSLGEDIIERHGIKGRMTRDTLARALMYEILQGRGIDSAVMADLSPIAEERRTELCRSFRAAWLRDRLYVAPTTHFMMGGVLINPEAETEVPGLYAAGEICGGVHGANRLGGNAISEILVFGTVAGRSAVQRAAGEQRKRADPDEVGAELRRLETVAGLQGQERVENMRRELKATMWHHAGIIRSAESLRQALADLSSLAERARDISVGSFRGLSDVIKLQNMLLVSEMVCRSALMRTETRGAHYRSDHPDENNLEWLQNIHLRREGEVMKLWTKMVDLAYVHLER